MRLDGRGVHLDTAARLVIEPADAGAGVTFVVGRDEIPAHWSRVDAARLRMRLSHGVAAVSTTEHLLAALAGLGVDNARIHVTGGEIPAMDGSARSFVEAIDAVGLRTLPEPRRQWRVVAPVRVGGSAGWAELRPADAGLSLDVEIVFPAPIGRQRCALTLSTAVFRRELAAARTFGFLHEAERLWREGFARGASLDNTLVLDRGRLINPMGLRFPDEYVRHKMLDVVGDLALAGAPLIGAFRSVCGGHALNLALLRAAFAAEALVLETASPGKSVDMATRAGGPLPASP